MRHLGRCGIALLVLFSAWASPAENSSLPLVMANDNRTLAGELKNGVLSLRLELRQGRWYPEMRAAVIEMSTHMPKKVTHRKVLAR